MAKKNFYAVKAGRKPGIYTVWKDCEAQIKGFGGAIYKGFETKEEADAYMVGGGQTAPIREWETPVDFPVAYVDGSYDKVKKRYSYGAVILLPDGRTIELSGIGDKPEAVAERNVAGELTGAMTAIKWAFDHDHRKILIKHDYEGIARWARGEWKANSFCATSYTAFISQYQNQMELLFEKVPAHSGVHYNEMADLLAKKALKDA